MRFVAALTWALLIAAPAIGHARKFKYFVEVPPQHFIQYRDQTPRAETHVFRPPVRPQHLGELLEAFQQPRSRQLQVEIAPFYGASAIAGVGASGSTRSVESVQALSFGFRYGWSENLAFGFSTDYGYSEASGATELNPDESSQSVGWSDLKLDMRGHHKLSRNSRIIYGFDVEISPMKRHLSGRALESASDIRQGNRFSGGHAIRPKVGFQHDLGSRLLVGSKAGLSYFQERQGVLSLDSSEFSDSAHGSADIAAIIEKSLSYASVGGELRHEWRAPYATTFGSGLTQHHDPSNVFVASVYAGAMAAEGLWLKPILTYSTVLDRYKSSGYKYDQYDRVEARVVMRMDL